MFPYRLDLGLSCISSQLHIWTSVLPQDHLPVCLHYHHPGVGHYMSCTHLCVWLGCSDLLQNCGGKTQTDTEPKFFLWYNLKNPLLVMCDFNLCLYLFMEEMWLATFVAQL